MRKEWGELLIKSLKANPDMFLLTGDLGYGFLDYVIAQFPDQAFNCGAAEQSMMDMAVGLAYEGKIPVVYSITPFLLYRPFETLRTYIDHEKLKVILVGSGRDKDYAHDGFSHDATDDMKILTTLHNFTIHKPARGQLVSAWTSCIKDPGPSYLNLSR